MDRKFHETTNLCVEIMKSKRQVKGKLGHVVQIRVFLPTDVNLMLNLPKDLTHQDGKLRQKEEDGKTFVCDKLDRAFLSWFSLNISGLSHKDMFKGRWPSLAKHNAFASSLCSRRLEVVSERENERAQGRHACLLARPFFLLPTTSKRLLRRLVGRLSYCVSSLITVMIDFKQEDYRQ